jgi:hypothetical protein
MLIPSFLPDSNESRDAICDLMRHGHNKNASHSSHSSETQNTTLLQEGKSYKHYKVETQNPINYNFSLSIKGR